MIEGKEPINPAYKNPVLAREIAGHNLHEDLKGAFKWEKKIFQFYGKRHLAKQLLDIQQLYYDDSKMWWYWSRLDFCWKMTDEVNILNIVNALAEANTINSKERTEIITALKQEARLRKPKDPPKTWVQFKDEIRDIKSGLNFKATPKYFITNPIPYALHSEDFEETPVMDKIFEEWVGKDHVKTLYEIIAYCLLPDYPINRLFCFIGAGLNGKSKFLELLRRFIGANNCCSTELDLLLGSRFEITKLHKKLMCQLGETNFNEMNNTSIIKKLTGGDLIGYEYKNKLPFDDINYAKILIATNNLPITNDKSLGFYRRWLIIDFPNQFSEKIDILSTIPEEEYECLATKSTATLYELLKSRKFHNEGTIDERMKHYEDKSDPFNKFLNECVCMEDCNEVIPRGDFKIRFNDWLKKNGFRTFSDKIINKKMKEEGIEGGNIKMEGFDKISNNLTKKSVRIWYGLKWKHIN